MKTLDFLRPPWLASARSSRWLAVVLVVALALAEVPVFALLDGRARLTSVGTLWCFAIAAWWLLVMPNALWLGRDAIALRLPHVRWLTNASVLVYAILMVIVPATAFTLLLGHPLVWYVGFTLAIIGSLLFMLLPSGIWIGLLFAFVVVSNLPIFHFALPGADRLALYGAAPALALAGLVAWLWFRTLGLQAPAEAGLRMPVAWNLRVRSNWGFSGMFSRGADAALARGTGAWLAPVVDLRRVGPAHPVHTIRVALGRNAMPSTSLSRLRMILLSLFFFAIVLSPSIPQALHGGLRPALDSLLLADSGGFGMASMIAAIGPVLAVMLCGWPMHHRLLSPSGELALLNLLPRLGDVPTLRRSAALACLAQATRIAIFEAAALFAIGWWIGIPGGALPYVLLCGATTIALVAAPILGALGGRRTSGWFLAALTIVTAGAAGTAAALVFVRGGPQGSAGAYLIPALLLLLIVLSAFGWQSWRALQQRPHPFLGIAP